MNRTIRETENREHLIATCEATEHIWAQYREKLSDILKKKHCDNDPILTIPIQTIKNPSLFTSLALDCTSPVLTHIHSDILAMYYDLPF